MDLWELNNCVAAYNKMQEDAVKERLAASWQTANFVGAAFCGKLRKLDHYMDRINKKCTAPKISKEEFEQKLAQARKETVKHVD